MWIPPGHFHLLPWGYCMCHVQICPSVGPQPSSAWVCPGLQETTTLHLKYLLPTTALTLRLLSLTFLTPLTQSYLREYLLVSSMSSCECTGDNWKVSIAGMGQILQCYCHWIFAMCQLLNVCAKSDKTSNSTEDTSLLSSLEGSHFNVLSNTGLSYLQWRFHYHSELVKGIMPSQAFCAFTGAIFSMNRDFWRHCEASHCERWIFGAKRLWLLCKALCDVEGQHLSYTQFGAIS